ncbi:acyl-CoA dehydrogenase family protein [Streptomyces sp. NPDC014986]|uniref:acyl-CoA dehydrogenase family protein n=1 Tax=Streptomyces sp. NPDC014986 TaxID=3364934 RepID=UPI00370138DE
MSEAPGVLPPGRDAREVLTGLAHAGTLDRLYPAGPAGRIDAVLLRRLLGAADARGPQGLVLSLLVQLATALPLLAQTASSPVAEKVLGAASEGQALLALAATDEQAGSDLTGLATRVDLTAADADNGGTVVLDGVKRWVTSATTADHALVLARHRPGRHFTSFTWLLVPLDTPGVSVRPADTPLFAGSGVGHVTFSGCRLDRGHLLGRPGRGLALFARNIAVERLASAAWGTELCRRVLADTATRLAGRTVDGTPLDRHPAVRQRLAECAVRVSALDALWTASCDRITGERDATAAAVLKAASGATVDHVLSACAQLWGADGFSAGGIQQLRAEAALFGIGGGATEVVLDTVADRLVPLVEGLSV